MPYALYVAIRRDDVRSATNSTRNSKHAQKTLFKLAHRRQEWKGIRIETGTINDSESQRNCGDSLPQSSRKHVGGWNGFRRFVPNICGCWGNTVCRERYRHTAIDPYQSTVWDGVGMECLEAAGLRKFIEVFEEPSCLVLPRLLSEGRRFGVIYVDGSHLFEDVFVDAYFCARLLTVDGYLLFDDSSSRHVAKVLAFIDNNQLELERLPGRLFRHRIARFVGKRQLTVYQRRGPIERNWDSPFHSF